MLMILIALMLFPDSAYDFKFKAADGKEVSLEQYKGKKVLIVNTASECGYTPQYAGLEKLYRQYKDKLVVIGFPSNEFGGQEPGSDEEIQAFCRKNYDVTFPVMSKIEVKGDGAADLFKWLTRQENPDFSGEIKWNFEKFLLDENGNLLRRFRTKTEPLSEEIIQALSE